MMYRRIKIDLRKEQGADEVTWRGVTFKRLQRGRLDADNPTENFFELIPSPSSCDYGILRLCGVFEGRLASVISVTYDFVEGLGINVFRTERAEDVEFTLVAKNGECKLAVPDGYSLEDGTYKVQLVKQ